MRRLGPAKALSIGFVASLVLALVVGASLLPAGGAPANPKTNRFGPSGIHTADPLASRAEAAQARAQAATAAAGDVASVPGPSVAGSGGCPDGGTNVRVNQDCTNQSAAGFFGRSQAQDDGEHVRHLTKSQIAMPSRKTANSSSIVRVRSRCCNAVAPTTETAAGSPTSAAYSTRTSP